MKVKRLRATAVHKRLVATERSDYHHQVSPPVPLFYRELSLDWRSTVGDFNLPLH